MIKRALACLALIGLCLLTNPLSAAAFNPIGGVNCTVAPDTAICSAENQKTNPISGSHGIIIKATNIVSIIAGIAGVIMVLVGGLRYVISDGDSAKTASAKNTIIYALVGLVIAGAARSIVAFAVNKL